jgi:hypothetical protein
MRSRAPKPAKPRRWPFGKSRHSKRHPVVFFISYENHDGGLIKSVLKPLFEVEFQGHIAPLLYWEESSVGGERPWKQIYNWIRQCDGVLVLITQNAVEKPDNILREIRYARIFCKPVFPLKDSMLGWDQLGVFRKWQRCFTFKDFEIDSYEPKSQDEFKKRQQVPDLKVIFTQILKEHYGHSI